MLKYKIIRDIGKLFIQNQKTRRKITFFILVKEHSFILPKHIYNYFYKTRFLKNKPFDPFKKYKKINFNCPLFIPIIKSLYDQNLDDEKSQTPQAYFKWGGKFSLNEGKHKKNMILGEDSFIRSIATSADANASEQEKESVSCVLDDLNYHWNCFYPNRLEIKLNSNKKLSKEQLAKAKKAIKKIKENHITKYNFQPIYTPEIGRKGVKKVLVIDQSYKDQAIKWANGSTKLFEKMLNCAVKENPDADIIIKVHPDAFVKGPRTGYYNLKNTVEKYKDKNIFLFSDGVNPISILNYVDKVYVMSSGMGFEALMCGKETVVFGCPFYAGWGISDDRNPILKTQKLKNRRNKKRTLEELFYFSYIDYSIYINPDKKQICDIEKAIDWILKNRKKYFKTNEVKNVY